MTEILYDYPFDDFSLHYGDLLKSRQPGSYEANVIRVVEYMKSKYDSQQEAMWKSKRFLFIVEYIADHIHEFDTADFAVYGSPKAGALLSEHLVRAVHHIFTTSSLNSLEVTPSPESVLELAKQYQSG
jgi:hypothetical protein